MANKNLFAGSRLPPGFRFHPTDVELVMYYLKRKVSGKKILQPLAISEVDIYKYAPWELQHKSCWHGRDLKWYFFCPAEKKYANGGRMRRSTDLGYWKTTGKDREVQYNKEVVGMIKTLVFHRGKAPKGTRTDWVMYEYRLEHKKLADEGVVQDSYVLCILFEKEGPGPKNGAQYGAPFREEDWENDDDDDDGGGEEVMVEKLNGGEVVSLVDVSAPSVAPVSPDVTASTVVPVSPVVTDMPPSICTAVLASCSLENLPSADVLVPDVSNFDDTFFEALGESSDELDVLLASFSNEHPFNVDEARNFGSADMFDNGGIVEADQNIESVDFQQPSVDGDAVDGDNIFNGLGELNYLRDYNYYGDFLEMLDMSDPMDFQADPPTESVLGELK